MIRVFGIQSETDYTTFDIDDFTTSDSSLPINKRFAVAAHGLFVTDTRRFLFEYVRSGPKAEETVTALQSILQGAAPGFRGVRLTATPVIDETFLRDVNRLERVRVVRIDVAEPNAAWTDWDEPLHELGDESGADRVTLEATAPRSESLKKNKGIVQLLRQALKAPNSHLTKAVVQGRLPEEAIERTLRTDNRQEFETRQVNVDSGGSTNVVSAVAVLEDLAAKARDEQA